MKQTIRIPLVLIIIFIVAVIVCIKSFASTTGTITEITVNVREKASIDSNIIMFVTQDDKVEILDKIGDWYKIKYKNKQGYVYSDFVKVEEEIKSNEQEKLINEDEEITKTIEAKIFLPKSTGIRIAPNITSNIIYTTPKDSDIQLLEKINGWSYIRIEQIYGWVRNEQIKETTEEIEQEEIKEDNTNNSKNETAYIKYESVNLRKEPSTDSTIIAKLKLNTEVTIIEEVDSVWNKVNVGENTGYISKDLLSKEKTEEKIEENSQTDTTSRDGDTVTREETKNEEEDSTQKNDEKKQNTTENQDQSSKGEEVVAYAKQFLGYDYVYGGASPTGFDCSGFTYYVYKHFGYTLSRSSVAQANNGTKVEKEDLKPGDLVIYKNTSLTRIGHVGIYIGDNKMIHASEPGVGVTITDIDSKAHKYPQRFVMGRRIIK